MGNKICPFCGKKYSSYANLKQEMFPNNYIIKNNGTENQYFFNLDNFGLWNDLFNGSIFRELDDIKVYKLTISRCPHCQEEEINLGYYAFENSKEIYLPNDDLIENALPRADDALLSNGVLLLAESMPPSVQQDYKGACAIVKINPKASAALARRALEGIVLDFWEIPVGLRGNLKNEIECLQGQVTDSQWKAINLVVNTGNIANHMNGDTDHIANIDKGEAEILIRLIDYLVQDCYGSQNNDDDAQNQFFEDIIDITSKYNPLKSPKNCTITNNAQIKGNKNKNAGNINIKSPAPKDNNEK